MNNYYATNDLKNFFDGKRSKKCPYACHISTDTSEVANASLVLYHAREVTAGSLFVPKLEGQVYALVDMESAQNTGFSFFSIENHYFDLFINYRLDSEYPTPYGGFIPTTNESLKYTQDELEEAFAKKTKLAFALISNCMSFYVHSGRVEYIQELSKHMEIFKGGKCFKEKCDQDCEKKLEEESFFVLAFENSICNYYVTEKFWRVKRLVVPVVLKRSVVAPVAPANTFIAADDFADPKGLADYLIELSNNKEKYFDWTRHYSKFPLVSEATGEFYLESFCQLCRDLHFSELRKPKRHNDFHSWYDKTTQCFDHFGTSLLSKTTS